MHLIARQSLLVQSFLKKNAFAIVAFLNEVTFSTIIVIIYSVSISWLSCVVYSNIKELTVLYFIFCFCCLSILQFAVLWVHFDVSKKTAESESLTITTGIIISFPCRSNLHLLSERGKKQLGDGPFHAILLPSCSIYGHNITG